MNIFDVAAGFFSSAVAAMGLGGGGVLIIWLLLAGVAAEKARGINLLLFIPSAIIALIIHMKNGLIKPKKLILPALGGLVGSAVGVAISLKLDSQTLAALFGWFLVALGVKELVGAAKKKGK